MLSRNIALGIAVSVFSHAALANEEGYALTTVLWDSPTIPVCWEDLNQSTAVERSWVENAVANTWESVSDVDFTGWGACTSASSGVRIRAADIEPHVIFLGSQLGGVTNGMALNFDFVNWGTSCQSNRQVCAEVIAIHEFGHALGFAHEQNRPDTPSSCTDAPIGIDGNLLIGAWDLHSVMNYCNPEYNGNGDLSDTDIEMVQRFYSDAIPPQEFSNIQSYWQRSQYIHMESGSVESSNAQTGWWSTMWEFEPSGEYYRIRNRWHPDQYLNIESGSLSATSVQPGWHSADWTLTKVENVDNDVKGIVFRIQNRWQPDKFINIESGNLQATSVPSGWHSSWWILNGVDP